MKKFVSTKGKHGRKLPAHLWKPGQCGNPNGRPKGSRNKLSDAFIRDLFADWSMAGPSAIQACRLEDPSAYLRVVASLVPKEFNIREGESNFETFIEQFDGQQLDQLITGIIAIGSAQQSQGPQVKALTRRKPDSVH